jgi:ABC-type branched-subunit amino acid transport system ATPase component
LTITGISREPSVARPTGSEQIARDAQIVEQAPVPSWRQPFEADPQEAREALAWLALLGRNGVRKTTTLQTLMGLLKPTKGTITFDGHNVTSLSPDRINRRGIAIVPEGRRIFPNLTGAENLTLAQREGGWPLEDIYQLFPKLRTRRDARGENLSGGERQMLAIGRALCAPQRLILLDEPFEGLATPAKLR